MSRSEELQKLFEKKGWGAIRRIAEPFGIEKPAGGWDEAIPLIIEAEAAIAAAVEDAAEAVEPEPEAKPEPAEKPKPAPKKHVALRYKVDWYKASGIPFCEFCGAANPTDPQGNPVCPIKNAECPRL